MRSTVQTDLVRSYSRFTFNIHVIEHGKQNVFVCCIVNFNFYSSNRLCLDHFSCAYNTYMHQMFPSSTLLCACVLLKFHDFLKIHRICTSHNNQSLLVINRTVIITVSIDTAAVTRVWYNMKSIRSRNERREEQEKHFQKDK